jgi:phosphoribosylformylglycinamidine synthase II
MTDDKILQPTTLEDALGEGLTEDEWQTILQILGRKPNITELGVFALMWSEHCSYKSSRVHLKRFPTEGEQVVQGPGENAGAVAIGNGLAAVFKMESHNHPSYVEPYQGAATGVGGILRDVFTMGARPIANLNSLRFGEVDHEKTHDLVKGVVAGIGDYGNCMGIPTVGGDVYFHKSYNGNNLVNAFTLGISKVDRIFKGIAEGTGNPVMYVGAKTGRDGIHGAGNLASKAFTEEEVEQRPTVQVGDPFMEKLLLEACMELMAEDIIVGIQDMGAAGLSSSSFEMASRSGTGIIIDLDKVPAREEGMTPYEFMLSESQERMLMVAHKGKEAQVKEIFEKWDLHAEVIGEVTDTGQMVVMHQGRIVADLPVKPLADEAPCYNRPIARPDWQDDIQKLDLEKVPDLKEHEAAAILGRLLASPNMSSREWIYNQYDSTVRTNTLLEPGSADAAVVRIKGTDTAIAIKSDCNSRHVLLDPREGAKGVVAEAARNIACTGAKPLAITDCLNFGNPERPETMWQFSEAVDGISEACIALNTPVTGGNVSFYNETAGRGIAPTPMIGMVGLIEDATTVCSAPFKHEGDAIILLGETKEELGGSEYLASFFNLERGLPPAVNLKHEKALCDLLYSLISSSMVNSAHDCSDGGLAVAATECCFNDDQLMGATIEYDGTIRLDAALFGESYGRVLVSCPTENVELVLKNAHDSGIMAKKIGNVTADSTLDFKVGDQTRFTADVQKLHAGWKTGLVKEIGL